MEVKQVIVIRKDLASAGGSKIRRGKEIGQCCHATISFLLDRHRRFLDSPIWTEEELAWMPLDKQKKIILAANNEAELLEVEKLAKEAGLTVYLVTDAGYTEFKEPTRTCLGIGPHEVSRIDKITGPQGIHPLKPY